MEIIQTRNGGVWGLNRTKIGLKWQKTSASQQHEPGLNRTKIGLKFEFTSSNFANSFEV